MISLMKEPIISVFSLAAETYASKGFLLEFHWKDIEIDKFALPLRYCLKNEFFDQC